MAAIAVVVIGTVVAMKLTGNGSPPHANGHSRPSTENTRRTLTSKDLEQIQAGLDAVAVYISTDRLGEAGEIIDALAEEYPQQPEVMHQLVEVKLLRHHTREAYEAAKKLTSLTPNDAEAHFNAGMIADDLDELDAAISHFRAASSVDTGNPKHPLYTAQIYIKKHDYRNAQIYLLQAVHLDESQHIAWGTLAEVELLQNQVELASQHIAKARQLGPDVFKWRLVEARILRRQNKPEDALLKLNALDETLRLHKETVKESALCWALMGQPDKAAELHILRLEREPDAWDAAIAAADYLLKAEQPDEARDYFGIAKRINPDAPQVISMQSRFNDDDG